MAVLLNIDTAVETASVCLSGDTGVTGLVVNENQKDHAAWLHNAIDGLIQQAGVPITDLEAVAISIGPGSYTGLRIGLAAAKGLCYALNIPLITINTLEMMAHAVKNEPADLFCPLIDARRMEVFTGIYDQSLKEISKPGAMIINKNSFAGLLSSNKIVFCGNGSKKLQTVLSHANAVFSTVAATAADLAPLANANFVKKEFASLSYTEPLYIKEFYSPAR
jgi:tRNA threonylcarbamoyladenosine biosynthesis protein TsaB